MLAYTSRPYSEAIGDVSGSDVYPIIHVTKGTYGVVFDEGFSSALSYTSRPYSEAMAMRPAVTYTPYAMSSREQTGDVITFTQFEKGNILTDTHNDAERGYDEQTRYGESRFQ